MTQLVKRSDEMHASGGGGGGGDYMYSMYAFSRHRLRQSILFPGHQDNSETWLMASL